MSILPAVFITPTVLLTSPLPAFILISPDARMSPLLLLTPTDVELIAVAEFTKPESLVNCPFEVTLIALPVMAPEVLFIAPDVVVMPTFPLASIPLIK